MATNEPVPFVAIGGVVIVKGAWTPLSSVTVTDTVEVPVLPLKPSPVKVRASPGKTFASYDVSFVAGVVLATKRGVTTNSVPLAPVPSLTTI